MDDNTQNKNVENKRALVPTGASNSINKSVGEEEATVPIKTISTVDGVNDRKFISRSMAAIRRQPVVPVTPSADMIAQKRVRVNRILMRKRHIDRAYTPNRTGLGLMVTAAILFILFAMLISGGTGSAYAYYQAQLPLLNGIASHSLFQTTRIYDRNGKLLFELYDHQQDKGRRTYVNYSDISPLLVNATIATEDHTFWTNSGVDYNGVVRAAVADLQHNSAVQGASTVTEQLVNNEFFNNEKGNLQVKGEELVLATGLTQQYPKWKIMEMYLNTVYYGDLNYGVEAAAENYFRIQPKCALGKCKPAVSQLDLAQASMLAGLPQSPSYYDPVTNKPAALQRQKLVLQSMYELGMITKQQVTDAENETAKFTFESYSATHQMLAPHFVNYVIDNVLAPMLGSRLADGGLNVYTTLDYNLEKQVEQIVYDKLYKPQYDNYLGAYGPLYLTNNLHNAAVVVMNPKNGEILAMDGSANFNQNNPAMQGQDNAALALRQPGSSFKPIVYATAFEMGWYPGMIVPDHKTYYPVCDNSTTPPKCYSPQNYDSTFHTSFPMTIRTAVANSYNIPAIDTIEFAGVKNVVNMAGRLGLSEIANLPADRQVPSMAIGSDEVTPLDMTSAYATFANQGVREPQTSVLEITDNQNQVLYKYDENHPQGVRALGADVSYLVSNMLSDKAARYHEFSPGNYLELDRPAAAKTGTTDSFRDNWTMGYTPYLAAGVWAGNSDNEEMTQNTIGITGAAPIWHDVMELASNMYNFPASDFPVPSNVHQGVVSATTGLAPTGGATVTDWFIDGTLPTISGSGSYYSPAPTCTIYYCKNNGFNSQP